MILLENNVISNANLSHFGTNPFLMTDHLEALQIMNSTDDNVGLLVDVAHLKVSSESENFVNMNTSILQVISPLLTI